MNWKAPALLMAVVLGACGGHTVTPAAPAAAPATFARTKLVTIVGNLASYRSGRYWAFEGSPVTGPDAEEGFPENWRAVAFSPSANHTATVIQVGVGLVSGTDGLVLSLNRDDKGIPGKAIATGYCIRAFKRPVRQSAGFLNLSATRWLPLEGDRPTSHRFTSTRFESCEKPANVLARFSRASAETVYGAQGLVRNTPPMLT
ncbi:MAG TPA: hypothetical protein VKR56_01410 [Candidatus Cybelea sp.]|nr:hypothetical protein [Candidatus Cybelea sp.]